MDSASGGNGNQPTMATVPQPIPAPPTPEQLRSIVARSFPRVYDVQAQGETTALFVDLPPGDRAVEQAFKAVRRDLKPLGYLPVLKYQGGEHVIIVVPQPFSEPRQVGLHAALYAATWMTTIVAGTEVVFQYRYWDLAQPLANSDPWAVMGLVFTASNVIGGTLLFALPLMLILTVHELGHMVMARKHGVQATLPFFLPMPPLFALNIGTMGAFINMREPIPDRKALLDIGAAGPLAGLAVALPVTVLGLWLMTREPVNLPATAGLQSLGAPLLYQALSAPFPLGEMQLIHPLAFAGWVGLLVTGINLLPAGQLDGGHVAHALLGKHSRWLSFAAVGILLVLGVGLPAFGAFPGFPGYGGWLVLGLLVVFLGLHHPDPLNGLTELDPRRVFIGIAAMVLLVLCFAYQPIG